MSINHHANNNMFITHANAQRTYLTLLTQPHMQAILIIDVHSSSNRNALSFMAMDLKINFLTRSFDLSLSLSFIN